MSSNRRIRVNLFGTPANPVPNQFVLPNDQQASRCILHVESFSVSHYVPNAGGNALGCGIISLCVSGLRFSMRDNGSSSFVAARAPLRIVQVTDGSYVYARSETRDLEVSSNPFGSALNVSLRQGDGISPLANPPDEWAVSLVFEFLDI